MAAFSLDGLTFNTTSGTHTVTLTPGVGDMVFIVTASTGNTSLATPTDDNATGTYTLIATAYKNANADTMSIFGRTAQSPLQVRRSFRTPPAHQLVVG